MTFRVGQLVVYLGRIGPPIPAISTRPIKGGVYTVRAIRDAMDVFGVVAPGLILEEVQNAIDASGQEPCFSAERFRPVVTPSIEIFQAMLTPSKQSERV